MSKHISKLFTISILLMLFSVVSIAVFAEIPEAASLAQTDNNAMIFEVAEDGARFAFDDQNLFDDGMPAYGTAFVTQGYLYPEGTLNGSNGVLEDGSPEFPELVLGTWTCYGWMIGEGAHTVTGEWVVSTQIYQFNDGSTIISNGFEIADFEVPYSRAISGGTGEYVSAFGQQIQTLHGFTDTMGVNLTVEFQLD